MVHVTIQKMVEHGLFELCPEVVLPDDQLRSRLYKHQVGLKNLLYYDAVEVNIEEKDLLLSLEIAGLFSPAGCAKPPLMLFINLLSYRKRHRKNPRKSLRQLPRSQPARVGQKKVAVSFNFVRSFILIIDLQSPLGSKETGKPASPKSKKTSTRKRPKLSPEEKKALKEARKADLERARRRLQRDNTAVEAAAKYRSGMTLAEMKKLHDKFGPKNRTTPLPIRGRKGTKAFLVENSRGVSQTVLYTSRFVDKLSEITDDLGISASIAIKHSKIAGSANGSFIDTDKFKQSDLNYYISVKVINQSINFRDALEFNPIPSVDKNNFLGVFGDSFISGFLEGGELNALISMKILNKDKATDIKAEAEIAINAGALEGSANAHVEIAKANLSLNTEVGISYYHVG